MRKKSNQLLDYFENPIAIGDAYFYGSPPTAGIVRKINRTSIVLECPSFHLDKNNEILVDWIETSYMTCKSPEKGVCLNKGGFI